VDALQAMTDLALPTNEAINEGISKKGFGNGN